MEAELLRRRPDGFWPEEPEILGPGDRLTLASIDFTIPVPALYRTTVLASGQRPPKQRKHCAAPQRCVTRD
jgi:hypothetical protein